MISAHFTDSLARLPAKSTAVNYGLSRFEVANAIGACVLLSRYKAIAAKHCAMNHQRYAAL
jgi:hypothetical protein